MKTAKIVKEPSELSENSVVPASSLTKASRWARRGKVAECAYARNTEHFQEKSFDYGIG